MIQIRIIQIKMRITQKLSDVFPFGILSLQVYTFKKVSTTTIM